jgi:hypothetical protein
MKINKTDPCAASKLPKSQMLQSATGRIQKLGYNQIHVDCQALSGQAEVEIRLNPNLKGDSVVFHLHLFRQSVTRSCVERWCGKPSIS